MIALTVRYSNLLPDRLRISGAARQTAPAKAQLSLRPSENWVRSIPHTPARWPRWW